MAAERPIDPDAVLFTGVANRLALAFAVLVADQTLTSEGAFCAAVRASAEEDVIAGASRPTPCWSARDVTVRRSPAAGALGG